MTHLADKKKKSDPPALYKHEGVAICLVMHLICCQQLCTWQLMLISLCFHYLHIHLYQCRTLRRCQRCGCSSHRRRSRPGGRGERELTISPSPNPTWGHIIMSTSWKIYTTWKNQISRPGEIIFFRSIFVCWDGQPLIRERCYASLTASSPHHIPAAIFKFSQNTYSNVPASQPCCRI